MEGFKKKLNDVEDRFTRDIATDCARAYSESDLVNSIRDPTRVAR
jgi:hypothetical protein